MKLNKTMSGLSAPTAATPGVLGEVGPNVNSVIIVGFAEVEVYGLIDVGEGTYSWSLIDTVENFNDSPSNGESPSIAVDPDHVTVNLANYEDVFFVSTSGQEETVRFFFVEDAVVAPSNVSKATKLEDISDMPAFTQADAGKVLSVNAQGNLAWITR
jgi:hypothetical protein